MNGHVKDSQTSEALWGANVYWKDDDGIAHGTSTDQDGHFDLPSATGQPVVFVTFMGFKGKALEGVAGPVEIFLEPSADELPGIDVYPDPPAADGSTVGLAVGGLLLLLLVASSTD